MDMSRLCTTDLRTCGALGAYAGIAHGLIGKFELISWNIKASCVERFKLPIHAVSDLLGLSHPIGARRESVVLKLLACLSRIND